MNFVIGFPTTKKLCVSAVASSHIYIYIKMKQNLFLHFTYKGKKRKACSQLLNVVFRRKSDKETCDTTLQVLTDRSSWCRDFLLVNIRRHNKKAFCIRAVLSSPSLYHERFFIQEYELNESKVKYFLLKINIHMKRFIVFIRIPRF